MAYVDLNPIRVKIAASLQACEHTSIEQRLGQEEYESLIEQAITPLVSGLEKAPVLSVTLGSYLDYLDMLVRSESTSNHTQSRWQQWVSALKKQQRVYGPISLIHAWLDQRNMQHREVAVS